MSVAYFVLLHAVPRDFSLGFLHFPAPNPRLCLYTCVAARTCASIHLLSLVAVAVCRGTVDCAAPLEASRAGSVNTGSSVLSVANRRLLYVHVEW